MNVLDQWFDRLAGTGDAPRIERLAQRLAIALAVVLALQLLLGGLRLATASAPDALLPSIDDTVDASLVGVEDVDSQLSDEMIARPLFWVSRRPVSVSIPTKVSPVVTSGKLKDIKLLGLFGVGDGAGIIAAIGGDKQRLRVGDKVKGWTLDTVERNEVVFSNGAQREKLQLKQQVFVVPAASGAGTGSGQATSGNKPSGKDVRPPSLGFGG